MSGAPEEREPAVTPRKPVLAIVATAAILIPGILFLVRFPPFESIVLRLALPSILAMIATLAIIAAGRGARVVAAKFFSGKAPDDPLSDFALGFPLFGTAIWLVSLVTITPGSSAALLVGGACFALLQRPARLVPRSLPSMPVISTSIFAIAALAAFLVAQLPATSLDELAYHLHVPQLWAMEGKIVQLPLLSHSWFPFGIESVSILFFSLIGTDGALASHLLHLVAAVVTTAILVRVITARIDGRAGSLAAAAIVTTPALLITAGWAWVEWPLVAVAVILFESIRRHMAEDEARSDIAVAIASGILIKYTFLPLAALLIVASLARSRRLLMPALAGFAVGSIYLLRNIVVTGNPFHPFLSEDAPDVTAYRWTGSLAESLYGYVIDVRYVDEALGAAILGLAVIGLIAGRAPVALRLALAGATVGLLLTFPSSRILLPFLVPAAIEGAVAVGSAVRWRPLVLASLTIAAASQIALVLLYVERLDPAAVLTGRVSDREYVATHRPRSATLLDLRRQLPDDARPLVLGNHELFWLELPARGGGNFDSPAIDRFLARDPAEVRADLEREGITHIVIDESGIAKSTGVDRRETERMLRLSTEAEATLEVLTGAGSTEKKSGRILVRPLED